MHYVKAKGLLSAGNGMNVYRGCTHGCIYCDSRSICYDFHHDFEDIEVKQNAPELLEQALRSKRKKCMLGTGSMTDPYLHLEETEQMTRRCLEIIERYGFGLAIQTKSDRIVRDIDLLSRINQNAKCVVQMTLTTADDELCKLIEPAVCTTGRRREVLLMMKEQGIPTVVWLSPILPFINDTEENLRGILKICFEAGVKGIINVGFGVTLRTGSREYFYKRLDERFPGMRQRYIEAFGNAYECNSPNHDALWTIFEEECKKQGVLYRPDACFAYLRDLPEKYEQMSLFDL